MTLALQTFFALIERDIAVFIPTIKDRLINALIWCVLSLVVYEYIMPHVGLVDYSVFMTVGTAATVGFFEVTGNGVSRFMADLEGERSITYYLTLPLPQWAVFARIALSNGLQALFIALTFLPLSKVLLGSKFSLAAFSWGKFFLMFILAHIFYGFFSLFLAAYVESLAKMDNVWMRIVYPMWWLGGYQFSWYALLKANIYIAYLDLLNPLIWILEGVRVSVLGQEGSLPYWQCVVVLTGYTILMGYLGIRALIKRLDCL